MSFVPSVPSIFSDPSFGPCSDSGCSGCQCQYSFYCSGCKKGYNTHYTTHRYTLYIDSRSIGKISAHDYTCETCLELNVESKQPGGNFVIYKSEIITHQIGKCGKLVHGTINYQ